MTEFHNFIGAAKRLDDIDIPRIGNAISVGEDEVHAFMDAETTGKGFDSKGRPKMLFEPARFYANLAGAERLAAVKAGLARSTWKVNGKVPKYPADSYPRLVKAMAINETAALKSASWGLGQVMGENFRMAGYDSPQAMVLDFMADEENHLKAMINFIISAKIDDDLRRLAALTRPTTPADCVAIVKVYNGAGYATNGYDKKFADAHNKWRGIKDTPFEAPKPVVVASEQIKPPVKVDDLVRNVQQLLRDKGYPEVGEADNKFGNRTRNSILAFEADNGMPLTGQVTDALLAALVKAQPRVMSDERQTATAKDLKDQGDKTVKTGDWLKKIGTGLLVSMGLGTIGEGTASIDTIKKAVSDVKSLGDAIGSLSPWMIGVGIGGVVLLIGMKVVGDQVEAYRKGHVV